MGFGKCAFLEITNAGRQQHSQRDQHTARRLEIDLLKRFVLRRKGLGKQVAGSAAIDGSCS
jgi:hypothetical protein